MPVHGIDHVEMYVGNAAQAAFYFVHAFGFTETAYAGLETGRRDRVSHVLEQGRIRLVLTGTLQGGDEIAAHHALHGDGVHKIALSVPDAEAAYQHAVEHGARGIMTPHWVEDEHGRVQLSSIATYGETQHLFVQRDGYKGAFLPGFEKRGEATHDPDAMRLMAIDHIVGNVELGHMEEWVHYYERVFGMTEMIHFSDEAISTEYSALMSKVVTDGSGRLKFPINEPAEGKRKSQIEEYIEYYKGAGAQHIALATRNIVDCVARAARERRRVPLDPRVLLRRRAGAHRRDRGGPGRPQAARDPRGPGRRGLPAPDLHEAGRRPPDRVFRDHRATRLTRLRRGELQGPLRGDRARAGAERKPLDMRYAALGSIPAKRHVQVRADGDGSPLLVEEVMGYEGFSGNESILLHLQSPCRLDQVGEFRPIVREEWVPDAHVHRLADANPVEPGGDPVSGRRLLMFNNDIEVSVCKPLEALDGFYRNGEGDEVLYIHRGSGVLRTVFGRVPFRERDYVVIPRGTTHSFELPEGEEQFWLCFHTPGEIETPNRYRNRYGQLLEHSPFSQRDFHPPEELETYDESGEFR